MQCGLALGKMSAKVGWAAAGIGILIDLVWIHASCHRQLGREPVVIKCSLITLSRCCREAILDGCGVRRVEDHEPQAHVMGISWQVLAVWSSHSLWWVCAEHCLLVRLEMSASPEISVGAVFLRRPTHLHWLQALWLADCPCTCSLLLLPCHQ